MNKKIFGIKVSTLLTVLMCFLCAVILWVYVAFLQDGAVASENTAEVVYSVNSPLRLDL